jgi:hypothetical protein
MIGHSTCRKWIRPLTSKLTNLPSSTQFDTLRLPACFISSRFITASHQQTQDFMKLLKTSGKTFNMNKYLEQGLRPKETLLLSDGSEDQYDFTCRALLHYKRLNGDMLVKPKFIVPDKSADWPEEMWNMSLGKTVHTIRNKRRFHLKRQELAAIGFDFNPLTPRYGYPLVETALLHYKKLHGDLLVHTTFVVPNDNTNHEKWPVETFGMNLGKAVSKIRRKVSYTKFNAELLKIGFNFDSQISTARTKKNTNNYDIIKKALLNYKSIHGNFIVLQKFVIPENSKDWPEETWNISLGNVLGRIRRGSLFKKHHEELASIGVDFKLQQQRYGYPLVKRTLQRYKEIHNDLFVPHSFEVPRTSDWPEESWDMKLGQSVSSIRIGMSFKQHKNDLRGIGFEYGTNRDRIFEVIKAALVLYHKLHMNFRINSKYVVPHDRPEWPVEMWGMKLGSTAANIRRGVTYKDKDKDLFNLLNLSLCIKDQKK